MPIDVPNSTVLFDDAKILREFVATGSPGAFRELVDRHLPTIHAAATRMLRRQAPPLTQHADDIAQCVFILLAQRAGQIPSRVPLIAWLYKATHYACRNLEKMERRRRKREAAMVPTIAARGRESESEVWLDSALLALPEKDRGVILLRYNQDLSVGEIARHIGLGEAAVKKRLHRALRRLRRHFANGPQSATAGLHILGSAPAVSMGPRIAAAALAGKQGAAVGVVVAGLTQGVKHSLALWKLKLAALAGAAVLLASGSYVVYRQHRLAEERSSAPPRGSVTSSAPAFTMPARDAALEEQLTGIVDRWGTARTGRDAAVMAQMTDSMARALEMNVFMKMRFPSNQKADSRYARTNARLRLEGLVGAALAAKVEAMLLGSAAEGTLEDGTRFRAITALGDLGLRPEARPALEAAAKGPAYEALLASVRVRLGGDVEKERAVLEAACADWKMDLGVRLACLEALCFATEGTLPANTLAMLASATLAGLDDLRYIGAVAETRAGWDRLMVEVRQPTIGLKRADMIGAMADARVTGSADFEALRVLCEKLVLDPATDADAVERSVYNVLERFGSDGNVTSVCSDGTIAAFVDKGVAGKDAQKIGEGLSLIQTSDHAVKFLAQSGRAFDAGDVQQKILALTSIQGHGFPAGTNYSGAVPLIRAALADSESRVRMAGYRTIAALKQLGAAGLDELRKDVEAAAILERGRNEGRMAFFALEKITDGNFKIEGDPRDKDGWLAQGAEADAWWDAHVAEVRQQAAAWALVH